MPSNYVCLLTGDGASCYNYRQLETITVLFIKSQEIGSLHEKKNHSQLLFTYRKSGNPLQIYKRKKRILFQLNYVASIPKPQMFKIFPELHLSSLFSTEHWQQHEVLFQRTEAWCCVQPSTRWPRGILIRASEVAPSAAGPREWLRVPRDERTLFGHCQSSGRTERKCPLFRTKGSFKTE